MSDFEFTHATAVESSAVDEVYYNANTQDLAVDLHDEVYVYHDVPKDRYESLVSADSVGRAFREVKQEFGPSEHLGNWGHVNYVLVNEETAWETPYITSGKISTAAVGTPKNLTYAPDAKVEDNASSGGYLTLSPSPVSDTLREHRVTFEVDGRTRTHTLRTDSVDSAVEAVLEIAEMLDLTFRVKEVTVVFE